MANAGRNCLKCLVVVFIILFFIFGIAQLATGSAIRILAANYLHLSDVKIGVLAIALIAVGGLTVIVGIIGCCGTVKGNRCKVLSFAVLVGLLLACGIALGIAAFVLKAEVEGLLESSMKKSMEMYDTNKMAKQGWDTIQSKLECCGTIGYEEWKSSGNSTTELLPQSCCGDQPCETTDRKGCLITIENLLKSKMVIVAGCGIGIGIVELLGVILACCLASSMKKGYEVA